MADPFCMPLPRAQRSLFTDRSGRTANLSASLRSRLSFPLRLASIIVVTPLTSPATFPPLSTRALRGRLTYTLSIRRNRRNWFRDHHFSTLRPDRSLIFATSLTRVYL